jgi:O-antigen ligase
MNENRNILFLSRGLHFYLLLAVIGTTLFSWFNFNSWLLLLLACCRLFGDGRPGAALRTAFTQPWLLAFFAIFIVEATGLLHTHDPYTAWKHVESKATLIALPFVVAAGPFAGREERRRLLFGYCLLLTALCVYLLTEAIIRYRQTSDPTVFFYHARTEALSVNAVFFSGYVLVALLFLLSADARGGLRLILIPFLTGMMVLLASKLLLALLVIVYLTYLLRRYRLRTDRRQFFGLTALVVLVAGMLAFTDNPVGHRYQEIMRHDLNGVSLRLFIWRSAGDILREAHAWVFGVSAGDSQDLLNGKFLAAGMSPGYLGYNFHNEYIEMFVHNGVVGGCLFLAAIGLITFLVGRAGTMEAWFTWALALLLALTQSTLETQHSLFLSCFFPLLMSQRPAKVIRSSGSGRD